MDLSYSHAHNQRVLKQRNLLVIVAVGLAGLTALLLLFGISRDREIVLQPVLRSSVTVSSAGVSREYLEMITRDVVVLTLDRSPQNLEYWMNSVLAITAPRAQGKIKGDLLKIVNDQRGSSVSQYFALEGLRVDTQGLTSEATGTLNTVVGRQVVGSVKRTFRFEWTYTGVELRLIGFGAVVPNKPDGEVAIGAPAPAPQ